MGKDMCSNYDSGYEAAGMYAREMEGKKMARGGAVKKHSDVAMDKKLIRAEVKPSALKKMSMGGKVRTGKATPAGAPSKPHIPSAKSKMTSTRSRGR